MDTSGIYKQLKAEGSKAFQNPVKSDLDKLIAKVTSLDSPEKFALATGGTASPEQVAAAAAAMQKALVNAKDMLKHTNILSGVDPGMPLTNVAKLLNAAKTIEGKKGCSVSSGAVGALEQAAKMITDTKKMIDDIDKLIEDVPKYIDTLPVALDKFAEDMKKQIVSDVDAIAEAQIVVARNAVAVHLVELTQDECFGAVFSSIMSDKLRAEVSKVTDKLKATKAKSILGSLKI